jgi:hypothetical protein
VCGKFWNTFKPLSFATCTSIKCTKATVYVHTLANSYWCYAFSVLLFHILCAVSSYLFESRCLIWEFGDMHVMILTSMVGEIGHHFMYGEINIVGLIIVLYVFL